MASQDVTAFSPPANPLLRCADVGDRWGLARRCTLALLAGCGDSCGCCTWRAASAMAAAGPGGVITAAAKRVPVMMSCRSPGAHRGPRLRSAASCSAPVHREPAMVSVPDRSADPLWPRSTAPRPILRWRRSLPGSRPAPCSSEPLQAAKGHQPARIPERRRRSARPRPDVAAKAAVQTGLHQPRLPGP